MVEAKTTSPPGKAGRREDRHVRPSEHLRGSPDRIDEAVRNVREQILPQLQRQDGFKGLIGLVERQDGRLIGVTLWESEEAMRASEEEAERLRGETARGGDQTIAGVQRCEVALFEVSS